MFTPLLAQTSAPGTSPATGPATQSGDGTLLQTSASVDNSLYISDRWIRLPSAQRGFTSASTLVLVLLLGFVLSRMLRNLLEKYQLVRAVRWATIAIALYLALIALHPLRMIDTHDIVTLAVHKIFAAILCLVAIRLVDRILIVPLLTRGGKVPVSRFIHQIIIVVVTLFVTMAYASWAFHIDLTSILAGSAVISIVLGLALQETLGNFFSGMVMQASSPFQIGDWIEVSSVEGRVVDMTWRTVTLHTNDDNYVLIPNGVVAKERIVNYHAPSRSTARTVKIGLEYEIAPNEAKRVLKEAALESDGVLHDPEPQVLLSDYGDSAIVYTVKFWIDHPSRHTPIENAVRVNAWYRLKQAGYNIPFQITTVELVDLHKKQQLQRETAEAERLKAIRKLPLFAQLNSEQMQKLAADSHDIELAAGQVIFRQNDAGDSLFVLVEGCVNVHTLTADGKEIEVSTIDAGSHFGELSAMTGQPRPTTIKAKTDLKAIEITRDHLKDLFASDPNLMTHMSAVIAQRQAERDAQLQKLGAKSDASQNHPQSVLDKMKGLFNALQVKAR